MRVDGDPDEELVRRIGNGEPAAMRVMVTGKLPRLVSLAMRLLGDRAEAEDVAQETFLQVWRHASRWKAGQARFDTWIHRVAVNFCYDRLRRRRERPTDDLPDIVDTGPAPDAGFAGPDMGQRVERALQTIAPRQREAIVLVYYQAMSNIDAAAIMEISVDALESLLSRGRRSLHMILTKGEGHA